MKYPLISEYIESIKHSEDNFNVLSNLRPVYDEAGEIVMSSGNLLWYSRWKMNPLGNYMQ